jgi:hypothetical protein
MWASWFLRFSAFLRLQPYAVIVLSFILSWAVNSFSPHNDSPAPSLLLRSLAAIALANALLLLTLGPLPSLRSHRLEYDFLFYVPEFAMSMTASPLSAPDLIALVYASLYARHCPFARFPWLFAADLVFLFASDFVPTEGEILVSVAVGVVGHLVLLIGRRINRKFEFRLIRDVISLVGGFVEATALVWRWTVSDEEDFIGRWAPVWRIGRKIWIAVGACQADWGAMQADSWPPASEKDLERDGECGECERALGMGDAVVLPCGHPLHRECIPGAISRAGKCPRCLADVINLRTSESGKSDEPRFTFEDLAR